MFPCLDNKNLSYWTHNQYFKILFLLNYQTITEKKKEREKEKEREGKIKLTLSKNIEYNLLWIAYVYISTVYILVLYSYSQ